MPGLKNTWPCQIIHCYDLSRAINHLECYKYTKDFLINLHRFAIYKFLLCSRNIDILIPVWFIATIMPIMAKCFNPRNYLLPYQSKQISPHTTHKGQTKKNNVSFILEQRQKGHRSASNAFSIERSNHCPRRCSLG